MSTYLGPRGRPETIILIQDYLNMSTKKFASLKSCRHFSQWPIVFEIVQKSRFSYIFLKIKSVNSIASILAIYNPKISISFLNSNSDPNQGRIQERIAHRYRLDSWPFPFSSEISLFRLENKPNRLVFTLIELWQKS